ncbi:hypothetical protein, partial [Desulfovibrio piger]|uniref:hypothetical protein n=1 Tax=Desulfovibrio piger TaxID=901 RepID=UPI0026F379C2
QALTGPEQTTRYAGGSDLGKKSCTGLWISPAILGSLTSCSRILREEGLQQSKQSFFVTLFASAAGALGAAPDP